MTQPATQPQPFAQSNAALPYQAYRHLLQGGPIHHMEVAPKVMAWLVCDYSTSRTLMSDARLSIDPVSTTPEVRSALLGLATEEKQSLYGRHLLATDSPDHTRMRRIMSRTLTARRILAMEPKVLQITESLLDSLEEHDEADLLAEFALPLTIRVLADLIGLPDDGTELFHRLGLLVLRGEAAEDEVFGQVIATLAAYLNGLTAHPDAIADGGLMRLLLDAHAHQEITDEERNSLLFQLFFAGHESTAYFITNAVATLLAHPDQFALLHDAPGLVDNAIEELLRYEGSVKSATWRFPTEPIEIDGVRIPAGDPVLILFAAANRDSDFVQDPDRLDITRPPSAHLSFGHGVHHCLGHALGRMEAKAAITSLITRYPAVRLSVPHHALPWRANIVMRGMSHLPVNLTH
ncbi:cytochrome P450 family protein [Streptomyces sp. RPT161]|uniref:cytochrome P450 family protein n=1 Tax=Streptomyces sp. RPT161 TaxID=3015993 RepID=UPI0022B85CC0|nr:cytochrome P450 [Streptomyces sp. RPT161]